MIESFGQHSAFDDYGPRWTILRAPLVGSVLGPVLIIVSVIAGLYVPDPPVSLPFQIVAAGIVGYVHGLATCAVILLTFLLFYRRIPPLPKLAFVILGFVVGAVFNVVTLLEPFSAWTGPNASNFLYSGLFFALIGAVALWRLFWRVDWVNQP